MNPYSLKWWQLLILGSMSIAGSFWVHIENLFKIGERRHAFKKARQYATTVNKPVLNYGCEDTAFGDINVDISAHIVPNFVQIEPSPAPTPFKDKQFAAVVCCHVIEHVPDPDSLMQELDRIADQVYMLAPNPIFLWTWIWPEHEWVFIRGRQFRIRSTLISKIFQL